MPAAADIVQRLPDLLRNPRESLDVELKVWLDLANDDTHRAVLAKAIIAVANHGGGITIFGFEETLAGVAPANGRPASLADYSPDRVNSAVNRFAEPAFHCDVEVVTSPTDGLQYPVVVVPGGHHFPIRSRRNGPNGQGIQQNVYYIRRPGPQSEGPQSGQEWDTLIRRCISNARDDLLNSFRLLMEGGAPAPTPQDELATTTAWFDTSLARWEELATELPPDHVARLVHGHYAVGYQFFDDRLPQIRGAEMLERLSRGEVRLTGWPPFWVPTRAGIAPYIQNGNIECWLGRDEEDRDSGHVDFWRVSPDGQFFLLRGYQEDGSRNDRTGPGEIFDLTLPTWRMGEVLLHAASMAEQLGVPETQVVLVAEWTGLRGRQLANWANPGRLLFGGHTAQQSSFRATVSTRANQIRDTLPELVGTLVYPLYELFSFFQLPAALIAEELTRLRERRL